MPSRLNPGKPFQPAFEYSPEQAIATRQDPRRERQTEEEQQT